MKFIFVLLAFAGSFSLFAQSDYAVTSKGDTLKGATKILTYDLLDRVQVKVNKKKKIYTALEVKAVFVDGVVYHTVKYDNGFRYMKLIKPGFLSLYGFRQLNQSAYDGQFLVMALLFPFGAMVFLSLKIQQKFYFYIFFVQNN